MKRPTAIQLVESATILAAQLNRRFCYIADKPRASVEFPRGSMTRLKQDARTCASIQTFYNECRARGAWVGD